MSEKTIYEMALERIDDKFTKSVLKALSLSTDKGRRAAILRALTKRDAARMVANQQRVRMEYSRHNVRLIPPYGAMLTPEGWVV